MKPHSSYHIQSSTGRLFLLKELFSVHAPGSILIITDRAEDISILQNFAKIVMGVDTRTLSSLGELFSLHEVPLGITIVPLRLLETSGHIDYLKKRESLRVDRMQTTKIESMIEHLIDFGYRHDEHLSETGTYHRTGSILSIETTDHHRVQIEWFDDEIDNIIDSFGGERVFCTYFIFQKIIGDHMTVMEESPESKEINTALLNSLSEIFEKSLKIVCSCDFSSGIEYLQNFADIHISDFEGPEGEIFPYKPLQLQHIDELGRLLQTAHKPIYFYTRYKKTLEEYLGFQENTTTSYTLQEVFKPGLESSELDEGFIITDSIISEIFVKKRIRKSSLAKNLDLLLTLRPGDYVVHREHGIAKFENILRKEVGGITREYLELHYADEDKLFVPITEIYRVSSYLSKGTPELTKLSGKEWEKTLEKTDEEITEIAMGIIETSARRTLIRGRAFGKFPEEEVAFQDAFPYEYTPDQRSAIQDVFVDMEKDEAMDRLISGDVGFGKTEVAMNAIYKAVLSGFQVAVISPLLVLADEHYETFCERLSPFGVRVGILTRMNSPKEAENILKKLKNGEIDVLVGTHRLLSHDIIWKRLGLLIIDEEHRFGVVHKERIKEIRANIDILSLSATPIPRTLNLALSGLRKISILSTPPSKKKPIRTIITKWNEQIITDAIRYELTRGGQVIILMNRIRGMESLAQEIEALLGGEGSDQENQNMPSHNPRIIITHGQMPGEEIEDRIHAFKKQEYDILISTTIIENGVNFLSANTILIIDPEEFGLASLHQLRGRVGRKDQEGFCYLTYRKIELTPDEKERLITIANNSHLGAGFEIAMRDLEIRGAGDILGIKQSGKSKDVGLTLYFRMLEEKIEELKDAKKRRPMTKIELDMSYLLSEEMFLSEQDKLQFFRDIENIETIEELEDIEVGFTHHLEDTKKHITHNLFLLLKARIIFQEYALIKLSKVGMNYVFDFDESVTPEIIKRFLERFDAKKRMTLLSLKKIRIETRHWKSPEAFLEDIIA